MFKITISFFLLVIFCVADVHADAYKEEQKQEQKQSIKADRKQREDKQNKGAPDTDKESPQQEQDDKKDENKEQKSKIPKTTILQQILKFFIPPKGGGVPAPGTPPKVGKEKARADSLKGKSNEGKQKGPSASKGSLSAPEQKKKQAESEKQTSQSGKTKSVPSGPGKKGASEVLRQNSKKNPDAKSAPGQKHEGVASGTGKAGSKSLPGSEQKSQGGYGSQLDSQKTPGFGVETGNDAKLGAGNNYSQTSLGQKKQNPGSTDSGQGKQPKKSAGQTLDGKKGNRGEISSSETGKEQKSGTQPQDLSRDIKDKVVPVQQKETYDSKKKDSKSTGSVQSTREDQEITQETGGTGFDTGMDNETQPGSGGSEQIGQYGEEGPEKSRYAGGTEPDIGRDNETWSGPGGSEQTAQNGEGGLKEGRNAGGTEPDIGRDNETLSGSVDTEQTALNGFEGLGTVYVGDEKLRLVEEIKNLKAACSVWQQTDAEFREWRKQGEATDSETREYAVFVADFKHKVIVSCEAVRLLGGDANKYCADCERLENEPGAREDIALPNVKRRRTREEEAALLRIRLKEIESGFDRIIAKHQAVLSGDQGTTHSNEDWADGTGDTTEASESAGGGLLAEESATGEISESEQPEWEAEPGAGPGIEKQGKLPEYKIEDTGDDSDDDVVARQLREAAESETDQKLKEQLWNEYRKYKKSTN